MAVINFTRGVPANESFPIDEVIAAAGAALKQTGVAMLQYGPSPGFQPLREWLAEWQRVSVDCVLTGNGSLQLPEFLCLQMLEPGDVVFVEAPTYDRTLTILRRHGAKVTGIPFAAGEFIEFREPNAAGYGDPLDRPPEAVREDVLDDFTTIELARDAYGVVFSAERTLVLDSQATEALRAELRESRRGSSLTDYFAGVLPASTKPVSVADNAEFGMS